MQARTKLRDMWSSGFNGAASLRTRNDRLSNSSRCNRLSNALREAGGFVCELSSTTPIEALKRQTEQQLKTIERLP